MNKFILMIIFSIFVIPLSGCTTNYSSTTQIEDSGYILLKGNFINTTLYVDETAIYIDATTAQYELNGKMVSKFPIKIGSHSIKVERDNDMLISKKIFLSNSETVEIIVP